MENKIYPSWRYHAEREPVIVESAEADAALGAGWADTPAKFAAVEKSASQITEKGEQALEHPKKTRKVKP